MALPVSIVLVRSFVDETAVVHHGCVHLSSLAHGPILREIRRWILRLTIIRAWLRSRQAIRHDLRCSLNRWHVRSAIHLIVSSQSGYKCFRGRVVKILRLLAHAVMTLLACTSR
ncbi:hypothetical protein KC340_g119 [Hortaea werneckii]|nr:hypothetical protein KC340_g119 [Hortaea werneckii]